MTIFASAFLFALPHSLYLRAGLPFNYVVGELIFTFIGGLMYAGLYLDSRKHSKQKKVKPISTNHSSATVNFTTDQTAKLEIKTSRYVFKNKTVEVIFGVFGHQNEFKHRKYIFTVPKSYQSSKLKHYKRSLLNKHCYENK